MYWNKQEETVFDIVVFLLVLFQAFTLTMITIRATGLKGGLFLVGLNMLLAGAMIPYARWVWKMTSYRKAFLKFVGREAVLLSIIGIAILGATFIARMNTAP